ncbi:MAG: hypothetical protein J6D29_04600 [Solobacterium sp.]|nr:hypothetical protein [Solobacterium sp.]
MARILNIGDKVVRCELNSGKIVEYYRDLFGWNIRIGDEFSLQRGEDGSVFFVPSREVLQNTIPLDDLDEDDTRINGHAKASSNSSDSMFNGTITFYRVNSVAGSAVKTKIIIDGLEYGALAVNQQLQVSLPYGSHQVQIKPTFNNPFNTTIIIDKNNKTINFPFRIGLSGIPEPAVAKKNKKAVAKEFGIIVSLVVLMFVLISILVLGKNSSSDKTSETANETAREQIQSEVDIYNLNDTIVFDDLEVTVTGYTFSNYAGNFYGLNPSDQDTVYLVVYVNVKNPTNEEKKLRNDTILGPGNSVYNFIVTYDKEYQYLSSYFEYSDFLLANESIMPLGTMTSKVLNFQVPKEIQNSDKSLILTMNYNSFESGEINWKLR